MEARRGVGSQGMRDSETFNRKFKNICWNWHLPFSTLTKKKKLFKFILNFFWLKLLLIVLSCTFFLAKIKVTIFVITYEQITKNVLTYKLKRNKRTLLDYLFISLAELCGSAMDNTLRSPVYVQSYPPNMNCVYNISLPHGKVQKLVFQIFDLAIDPECRWEYYYHTFSFQV